MPDVQQKTLTDAVLTRAGTLAPPAQVFRGEINQPLTLLPNSDRVGRYVVIYPFGLAGGPDLNLGLATGDGTYTFQATVVAGFAADCEFLTDQVRVLYDGWVPSVTGVVCGAFKPPVGYQPGTVRRDDTEQPPRFWVPLQFTTVATTN